MGVALRLHRYGQPCTSFLNYCDIYFHFLKSKTLTFDLHAQPWAATLVYGDLWMKNHASRGLVWVQKLLIKRPRTLLLQSRLHLTGVTASVTWCRPWLHTEYIKVKHTPVQLAGAAGTALTGHTMCAKPQCNVTMIAPRRTILVHHRSSARGPHSVWQYRVTGSR